MIKQLSAIDCWAQGWVVIAVRPFTQSSWFKHWCCQLKLRVVLLDKALIAIVWVHPAGIGYRHLLEVNWCSHPEEVNDSHLLNTTETRNTYAPSWLGEKQRWNDIQDTDWCFIVIALIVCIGAYTFGLLITMKNHGLGCNLQWNMMNLVTNFRDLSMFG